ncbi:GNAT family N-acetyltransferase [Owenweeksia hongkongensis]|uniref:GNAT family N-acetyltransferase n=1 Tax=Owenweeksia hongkongensis TaxID=253245 RepID=UPI003A8FEBA5
MEFTLNDSHENGQNKFELKQGNKTAAVVKYRKDESTLTVEHTEVMPDFRGTPAGRTIVEKVKSYTDENKLNLKSACSYFSHQLSKLG